MSAKYLMIGEVLRPQGVRGEVKVKPYAAEPEMFWTGRRCTPGRGRNINLILPAAPGCMTALRM